MTNRLIFLKNVGSLGQLTSNFAYALAAKPETQLSFYIAYQLLALPHKISKTGRTKHFMA